MMSRHANSSIYRLRPNHGVAFLDIEISVSQLTRIKSCFVEEKLDTEGDAQSVLLPVGSDNMFEDGSAWHPETFQPLGPGDALWISGHQGIRPLLGHWLPLPYLRLMTSKPDNDSDAAPLVDQGPFNWVRLFISPPEAPLHEASVLKAVLAIDTQLASESRLDLSRYNAPSPDDVSLGSIFVLTDDADQLANFLAEPWLNAWLTRVAEQQPANQPDGQPGGEQGFELEHIARYLFLLKVLCDACPAPILRFTGQSRERRAVDAVENELIVDLCDDIGLAVLVSQRSSMQWAENAERARILPLRDLNHPTNLSTGPLPIRVEFDAAPFGFPEISRRSGRSNAFSWASLVRVGDEAARLALRDNAEAGTTGATGLARHVTEVAPIAGMWRSSSDNGSWGKFGPPTRGVAMQHLTESGALVDDAGNAKAALRPRFSKSSLLSLFVGELVTHAVSFLNAPRDSGAQDAVAAVPDFLGRLRLSLPVSISAQERECIIARAREGIDFVWRANGWEADELGMAPKKPQVEIGLGGDFGAQLIYLHDQVNDVYGGDLSALIEDLHPVNKSGGDKPQMLRFASISIGFSATRLVAADYKFDATGGVRPSLAGAQTCYGGLDVIHQAIVDQFLIPAIDKILRRHQANSADADVDMPANAAFKLLRRQEAGERAAGGRANGPALQLETKVLLPAARALLEIYTRSPLDGARGVKLFTLEALVRRGGGGIGPLAELIDQEAQQLGLANFQLGDAAIAFSQRAFRRAIIPELEALLSAACSNIAIDQTDLVFVTSTFASSNDIRDIILSLLPISPHRLVILDEQWNSTQNQLALPAELGMPIRIGVLSTILGKRRLLDYDGLASIEQTIQIESEVA